MIANQRPFYQFGLPFICLLAMVSCKRMDDPYREFIKGGETIYVGKADSLVAYGGNHRVLVSWLLISDPKVTGYKLFWNNGRDSLTGSITKTDGVDTLRLEIGDLAEGTHHFDVYLYDNYGNSSIKASVAGKVYGERYERSLLNRAYRSVRRVGNHLEVHWMPADETMTQVDVNYIGDDEVLVKHVVPAQREVDTLFHFPRNGKFSYKTAFLPEAGALDTFYTAEETFQEVLTEGILDKASFAHLPLPTDSYQPEFDVWAIQHMWDNQITSPNFFYMNPNMAGLTLPNWFTLDLGYASRLTKMKVNSLSHDDYWMFNVGAPKSFEIYGSNDPAADGSWDSWTLLGTFESVKPSGLPVGQVAEEDRIVAVEGETFNLLPTDQFYRYVRFKTNSTWGGNLNVMIAELTFWGYQ